MQTPDRLLFCDIRLQIALFLPYVKCLRDKCNNQFVSWSNVDLKTQPNKNIFKNLDTWVLCISDSDKFSELDQVI